MPERRGAKPLACGRCSKDCKSGDGVPCNFCEVWTHWECVDGMTKEFVECSDAMMRLVGSSAFLCVSCRKISLETSKLCRM